MPKRKTYDRGFVANVYETDVAYQARMQKAHDRAQFSGGLTKVRRLMAAKEAKEYANKMTGGFLGIELKFFDNALLPTALQSSTDATLGVLNPSAVISFTTIAQGDGEQQRDGKRAVMKSLYVSGTVKTPGLNLATGSVIQPLIFIALVQDKQSNGAEVNSENIYKNIAANSNLSANPLRNLKFSSRFRVLAATQFMMPRPSVNWNGTTEDVAGTTVPFKLNWKGEMPVTYSGTTANIANVTDNSINLIAWASNTSLGPTIQYVARTRFVG